MSSSPVGFVLEGWDVADLAVEAGGVVPVDPLKIADGLGIDPSELVRGLKPPKS